MWWEGVEDYDGGGGGVGDEGGVHVVGDAAVGGVGETADEAVEDGGLVGG